MVLEARFRPIVPPIAAKDAEGPLVFLQLALSWCVTVPVTTGFHLPFAVCDILHVLWEEHGLQENLSASLGEVAAETGSRCGGRARHAPGVVGITPITMGLRTSTIIARGGRHTKWLA